MRNSKRILKKISHRYEEKKLKRVQESNLMRVSKAKKSRFINRATSDCTLSSVEQEELAKILDAFFSYDEAAAARYQEAIQRDDVYDGECATRYQSDRTVEVLIDEYCFNYHDEDWNRYEVLIAKKIREYDYNRRISDTDLLSFDEPFDRLINIVKHCYVQAKWKHKSDKGNLEWHSKTAYIGGLKNVSGFYQVTYKFGNDRT